MCGGLAAPPSGFWIAPPKKKQTADSASAGSIRVLAAFVGIKQGQQQRQGLVGQVSSQE